MRAARRNEQGAVLAIVAVAMVAVLIMAALVVDLGATRAVRRDTRSTADAAAAAGAVDMNLSTASTGCAAALGYAFSNLGGTQPTASAISTACSNAGMGNLCGTSRREAVVTLGTSTVRMVNPVPDGDPLLRGTVVGGGASQTLNPRADGEACKRVGVQVTRPQVRFFGGIVRSRSDSMTVHAVAKFGLGAGQTQATPALVTLNPTACKAIDPGSGDIFVTVVPGAAFPGLAYSDSDGSACTRSDTIMHSRASGHLHAAALGTTPGELAWFQAPAATGWVQSSSVLENGPVGGSSNYVGLLYARTERITSLPPTKAYRCTTVSITVQDPCPAQDDEVSAAITTYLPATSAPPGFTTYGCTIPLGIIVGNAFVNCPSGITIGSPLTIAPSPLNSGPSNPIVIFTGNVNMVSGGDLKVNTLTLAGSADPVAIVPSAQALLVIKGDLTMQSSATSVSMAQTTIVSDGGITIQGSPKLSWSPPTAGARKSLLYWTRGTSSVALGGSPSIYAAGVFYAGGSPVRIDGGGTINLERVQMWVDSVTISGGGGVILRADPSKSISVGKPGTSLIR